MSDAQNLSALFDQFTIDATYASAEPYGSGHINDTFLVKTVEDDHFDYIFQRINHTIFKDVPALMENISRVCGHLRDKLSAITGANPDRETLTVIPTKGGQSYFLDGAGNYWRVYIFLDHTKFYDLVPNAHVAYEGGRAFGRFQRLLADLPAPPLNETIMHFHDVDHRLDLFLDAMRRDPLGRAAQVGSEIEFVEVRFEAMRALNKLAAAGQIPLRVTHNDTKFNNVLLDENDKGLCVIDLDTVMPGFVHYDFGDAIRIAGNTAVEDETDHAKIGIDMTLFEGFTKGFLAEVASELNPVELEYLVFATQLMPFIIGLRFLTDYIDGDNYFKIKHQHHNLDRARCQFHLVRSIEENADQMQAVVDAALA